jgi:FlaA1/EpsC-like NDP-sugar epimerase
MKKFEGKYILITGACGTVGSELIKQLLTDGNFSPCEVIGIDNNESTLFFLDQEYLSESRAHFFVTDIRDLDALTARMRGIDIVFHCAALKHVILSERSPEQCVQNNIIGVQNVIAASTECNVETVIFTSSDKAVNPTNVMGTSKLMGERIMTAANSNKKSNGPIFASTRFGNVLGSSGSVLPIFHNQIRNGGPVTLTHNDMTRFVMSVKESVKLLLDSVMLAKGGEVFVTKMPVLRIEDLANVMIEILAPIYDFSAEEIKIEIIGIKPGEKLYEELMSHEEIRRTVELPSYFSVLPAFSGIYENIPYDYNNVVNSKIEEPYISSSQQYMTPSEIKDFLSQNNLLKLPTENNKSRYWPGDKESNHIKHK